jgi:hypothetical protein
MSFSKKIYENKYGYDLENYHKQWSTKTLNEKDFRELKNRGVIFKDESGENFELINIGNLLFVANGINIYPCSSIVYSTTGINWVSVIIIPEGKPIYCENDFSKSAVISLRDEVFQLSSFLHSDNNKYLEFLKDYYLTFSNNDWYNDEEYRLLIKLNRSLSIHSKLNLFKEQKLLNPLQLVFINHVYNKPMDLNLFFESVINTKKINRGIEYFHTNKHSIKFSSSTIEIIDIYRFREYFENFSEDDFHDFLNSYLITENLDSTKIRDEHLEIVLNSHSKSIYDFNYNAEIYKKYLEDLLNEIGLHRKLIDQFYKELKINFVKLENLIREEYGYDKVGSLYREKYIFIELKSRFPNLKIISQYSPHWLGRQRIDIFIEEINLAIEYNGKQHYEPIDFFGGKDGLINNQNRDRKKKQKCIENNVHLIEIKYNDDINYSINVIIKKINEKLTSIS